MTLIDNFPSMNRLKYSLNYAKPVTLKADGDGNVEILNPFLLEGLNTFIMEAYNGAGAKTRVVYYVILDMMPPQVYPKYPLNQQSIQNLTQNITGGIYDKGLDEFDPDRIKIYLKRIPVTGEFSIDAMTNDYEEIRDAHKERTSFSFNPGELDEGIYSVKVKVKDETGNESEAVWGFYIDRSPPSMEFAVNGIKMRDDEGKVTNHLYSPLSGEGLGINVNLRDNISGVLKNVKYSIYDSNNQKVKEIKSYISKSAYYLSVQKGYKEFII